MAERVDDVDVSAEMQGSYLEYAYSVIYARALPDARDGLKPVQRRILYQMTEMGLRPDRGHVKSARVVGDVMGKLHPHGDQAIYDALVRLAQPFVQRVTLVDGHGNFGSLDDGPAAPRYTEARLTAAALALTESLDEDVVDFVPNYDNSLQQPEVLPSAWPNLLVNGASGIAVGMATNMAPHNLGEVIAAARHLLAHPDATLGDLMAFVPGPDLPGGARIVGLDGIRDAYATGRGSFTMRPTYRIEQVSARRRGIVITELPYLVGPEKVIEKIKQGVQSKKLAGIADATDLTDRKADGLRLVIEVKTGFEPEAVLAQLYRHTPLEESFHMNNVAIVDGAPKTLGLREMLEVYLRHRISAVRRRSAFRLERHRDRLHLVEGLLIALVDIDEVIQIIRSSDDAEAARERLRIVFDLSERQAEYILELRLRRLTKFSQIELEAEADDLRGKIAELEALLADEALLRAQVSRELGDAADEFATPRRTVLLADEALPAVERKGAVAGAASFGAAAAGSGEDAGLRMADVPVRVLLSATGRILRVPVAPGQGEALSGARRRTKHDAIAADVATTTRGELGAITNRGLMYRMTAAALPEAPAGAVLMSAGVNARDYFGITEKGERIVGLVALDAAGGILAPEGTNGAGAAGAASAAGAAKDAAAEDGGPGQDAAAKDARAAEVSDAGDSILAVAAGSLAAQNAAAQDAGAGAPPGPAVLALGTRAGVVKRVAPPYTGKQAAVALITLKPGDEVVAAAPAGDSDELVFVTSDAQLLRFAAGLVRPQGAAAAGMAGIRLAEGAAVIGFFAVPAAAEDAVVVTVTKAAADDALFAAASGSVKVSALAEFPAKGRATGGVRAQRFVRGEAALALAWVGPGPAHANARDGATRELPAEFARRDASGIPLDAPIDALGAALTRA